MEWNLTSKIAAAALAFGVLFIVLAVALLGTPLTDIGMLSTALVFVLFGVFGILLGRAQVSAE